MADFDSALSELSALTPGTHDSLAGRSSEILADAIQALIEDELSTRIGAEPGERSPTRTAQRKGHRPKLISSPGGDITVGIPKRRVQVVTATP